MSDTPPSWIAQVAYKIAATLARVGLQLTGQANGDLARFDALLGRWVVLPPGPAGQVLTSSGPGLAPSWAAGAPVPGPWVSLVPYLVAPWAGTANYAPQLRLVGDGSIQCRGYISRNVDNPVPGDLFTVLPPAWMPPATLDADSIHLVACFLGGGGNNYAWGTLRVDPATNAIRLIQTPGNVARGVYLDDLTWFPA